VGFPLFLEEYTMSNKNLLSVETLRPFNQQRQLITDFLSHFGLTVSRNKQFAVDPLKWYVVDDIAWFADSGHDTEAEAEAIYNNVEPSTQQCIAVMKGDQFLFCQAMHLQGMIASLKAFAVDGYYKSHPKASLSRR
jgi:hypothetical protein